MDVPSLPHDGHRRLLAKIQASTILQQLFLMRFSKVRLRRCLGTSLAAMNQVSPLNCG